LFILRKFIAMLLFRSGYPFMDAGILAAAIRRSPQHVRPSRRKSTLERMTETILADRREQHRLNRRHRMSKDERTITGSARTKFRLSGYES
jgi:hypothetical protein